MDVASIYDQISDIIKATFNPIQMLKLLQIPLYQKVNHS